MITLNLLLFVGCVAHIIVLSIQVFLYDQVTETGMSELDILQRISNQLLPLSLTVVLIAALLLFKR